MLCGKTALQSTDWRGNSYKALQRFQAGLGKYFSLGNSAREEVNSIRQLQHSSSEVSVAVSSTAASLKEPPQIVFLFYPGCWHFSALCLLVPHASLLLVTPISSHSPLLIHIISPLSHFITENSNSGIKVLQLRAPPSPTSPFSASRALQVQQGFPRCTFKPEMNISSSILTSSHFNPSFYIHDHLEQLEPTSPAQGDPSQHTSFPPWASHYKDQF